LSWIEIPQRSSLLPGVLSFRFKAREALAVNRREFITVLGGAAAWPIAANAQQAIPVIGFLDLRSPEALTDRLRGFRQGLRETGYVEGDNVTVVYRWAENKMDRVPEMATELVHRQVAVMLVGGSAGAVFAAKEATKTIPILFIVPQVPDKLIALADEVIE
jgi:putative tryptophan/tyrosine transport system substrate-binding protein